jgi:hypothetical protein
MANYARLCVQDRRDTTDRLGLGQTCTAHYQPLIPADELERYQRMCRTGPLVCTPEQLVERLRGAEQMGMTYAIGNFADASYDPASMDLFANAVAAEFA